MPETNVPKFHFKPRARMLLLLGDQLIRDPGVAVFELVKNAFDADSPDATVTMNRVSNQSLGSIIVEDSGSGMDLKTVTDVWLEPGTDFRLKQKERGETTPVFGRVPIGEKGVGRFAAHKLGKRIRLITRRERRPEVVVEIDWDLDFAGKKYLNQVEIDVTERKPEVFKAEKTGTRIEVEQLRDKWTRGMVRDLARSINAICSPFQKKGDFKARLAMNGNDDWLLGLLDINEVLKYSLFNAHCELEGSTLSYKYNFTPYPGMDRVRPRTVRRKGISLKLPKSNDFLDLDSHNIGPVELDLYVFDREPSILSLSEISDKRGLKEFLNESGGVRVYRGGIRVYDYGERGNDWLGLGGRRVNVPAKRLSNNLLVGAVTIDPIESINLASNHGLIEKTNREGFVENTDFEVFRDATAIAIQQIETERNIDKAMLRKAYSTSRVREPVLEDLTELRQIVDQKRLTSELGPYLDRIEDDFTMVRDKLLTSATAGLSLSVVIHEVEKGVAELVKAVQTDKASDRVKVLAKHLADLIEGFAALVRRSGSRREKASSMISQALFNVELRLKVHGIEAMVDAKRADFEAKCSRRLIVSTIMNLIDNSIYWLDTTNRREKQIYVGTTDELRGGPAIVVGDNGPGFLDPPEYLIEPFITRKPDGMGLGLHIASEAMKAQKGKLVFPEPGDLQLPASITGAVVALVFGAEKE